MSLAGFVGARHPVVATVTGSRETDEISIVSIIRSNQYINYPFPAIHDLNVICSLICLCTVKPVLIGHSKRRPKIGFQDQLSLNAGQKYCRMLQGGAFCNSFDLHEATICH